MVSQLEAATTLRESFVEAQQVTALQKVTVQIKKYLKMTIERFYF